MKTKLNEKGVKKAFEKFVLAYAEDEVSWVKGKPYVNYNSPCPHAQEWKISVELQFDYFKAGIDYVKKG